MPSRARDHRVVVYGDQETWESCEGRGPRVVQLSAADYERIQSGDCKSVFERTPGLAICDLLAALPAVRPPPPRPPGRGGIPAAPAGVDAAAPFFTAEDFEPTTDGRGTTETRGRIEALAHDLDIWAGADLNFDKFAALEPEAMWWPAPRWRPRPSNDGPTVRLALGYLGGQPRLEHPALYVAAEWPSRNAVDRLLGNLGHPAFTGHHQAAKERMLAILAAARADGLPTAGPSWWLRRVDPGAEEYIKTLSVTAAIERNHDALDELAWDDLVAEIAQHFPGAREFPAPKVALIWRFEWQDLAGATLQEVVERIAPAFILARMAVEETLQPFKNPHPLVGAVRAGIDLLKDIGGYPTGWQTPQAPFEEDEQHLLRAALRRYLGPFDGHRADILLAHAQEWRRVKGIGLTGVIEMFHRGGW